MTQLTLKQAALETNGFKCTTRGEILAVNAKDSYRKCGACNKKTSTPKCIHCRYHNRNAVYALFLRVSIMIFQKNYNFVNISTPLKASAMY